MIASKLIDTNVRRQVADTKPEYRYVAATMLAYVNEGLRELWSEHPEYFYLTAVLVSYPGDLAALSEELTVSINAYKPLADYVCYRIFEETADDTNNASKMMIHRQDFERANQA